MLDVTDETSEQAPDFSSGYPSRGERIGPAWGWLWWRLGDGCWRTKAHVVEWTDAGAMPGQLTAKTIENLLCRAVNARLLERRFVRRKVTTKTGAVAVRKIAQYRRWGL